MEKFHVKKNISSKIISNLGKKGHFLVEKQYSHTFCVENSKGIWSNI